MNAIADILVSSPDGWPIAAIEVKNPQNLSRDVATELRRNLLAHGLSPQLPYFLLLSQDTGFLWKKTRRSALNAQPNYEFPMSEVVNRYWPERNQNERLREPQLELIILQWLLSLTNLPQETNGEPEKSLARSGLLESIRGATVQADARL